MTLAGAVNGGIVVDRKGMGSANQMATAQITLNLNLNSRPQPWLADWINPVNGQMIITYTPGTVINDPLGARFGDSFPYI